MILVIGGAFQGKLQYVKKNFLIEDEDICNLEKEELDLNKKCLYHFELSFLKEDFDLNKLIDKLEDKIIIMDDISCGVVPMEKERRLYRERAGKASQLLSEKAKHVIRIYFGLEQVLK